MVYLTETERELLRRGSIARRLIVEEDLDPWLALWWVVFSPLRPEEAQLRFLEEQVA